MRVTSEAKAATRQRILDAARSMFTTSGFEGCTTRQIADAAGIATGTLFNYFATKEAVLACLAAEAVEGASRDSEDANAEEVSFEEAPSLLTSRPDFASSSRSGDTYRFFWKVF